MSVNLPTFPAPQELRQRSAREAIERRERIVLVRIHTAYGPETTRHLTTRTWLRWVVYDRKGVHARRISPLSRLLIALGVKS